MLANEAKQSSRNEIIFWVEFVVLYSHSVVWKTVEKSGIIIWLFLMCFLQLLSFTDNDTLVRVSFTANK